jgi:hypothetical protein
MSRESGVSTFPPSSSKFASSIVELCEADSPEEL